MESFIATASPTFGNYTTNLWDLARQKHLEMLPWTSTASSFLLPGLLSLPFLYTLSFIPSLGKGESYERWRKNYISFQKLSPFILPKDKEHIRSDTIDMSIVIVCNLLSRITNVLVPFLLRRIVDKLADPTALTLPITDLVLFVFLRQVFNEAVTSLFWSKLTRVESDISNRLMCHLYDKTLALSADFHDRTAHADTYNTIIRGGPRFARFAMSILFDKTAAIIDLGVAMVAFQRIFGGHLALAMGAIALVYIWVAARLIPKKESPFVAALKLRRQRDDVGSDVVRNWHTVAAFNNIEYEQRRYRDATAKSKDFEGEMYTANRMVGTQRDFIMAIGFIVLALLASAKIKTGDPETSRSVGDFVMLLQYWGDLAYPIQNFVSWVSWFDEFFIESDKMIEIMEAVPSVRDREGAADFELQNGDIEFEHIGFSYDGQRPAVNDISFKIQGGQTVAIVGETGGGKSTLLRLLCRSYDVTKGSIRVDGQDIRDIRLSSLMAHVTIVPQIISVFNDTMETNLKYGKFDATQEDCEAACETAAFHKKISSFTNQYQEKVGEQGTKLSGGELQRLAIARALLRDSKIVLFDEAMSSLDSETEWKIQERLREFCKDKTVIIVAHRLATVAHADLILAVKDGNIVEAGTQRDLLEKKGYYYNLWDKQRLQ